MLGCDKTVTVINAYTDEAGKQAYQACVLSGVSWYEECAVTPSKAGDAPGIRVVCRVPLDRCRGYLPAADWAKQADKSGHWTLQPDSYVVYGALEALPSDFVPPSALDALGATYFRVLHWHDSRSAPHLGHIRMGGSR